MLRKLFPRMDIQLSSEMAIRLYYIIIITSTCHWLLVSPFRSLSLSLLPALEIRGCFLDHGALFGQRLMLDPSFGFERGDG